VIRKVLLISTLTAALLASSQATANEATKTATRTCSCQTEVRSSCTMPNTIIDADGKPGTNNADNSGKRSKAGTINNADACRADFTARGGDGGSGNKGHKSGNGGRGGTISF
jgi:hypothetical protein